MWFRWNRTSNSAPLRNILRNCRLVRSRWALSSRHWLHLMFSLHVPTLPHVFNVFSYVSETLCPPKNLNCSLAENAVWLQYPSQSRLKQFTRRKVQLKRFLIAERMLKSVIYRFSTTRRKLFNGENRYGWRWGKTRKKNFSLMNVNYVPSLT